LPLCRLPVPSSDTTPRPPARAATRNAEYRPDHNLEAELVELSSNSRTARITLRVAPKPVPASTISGSLVGKQA